jgi:hypothetical protein
MDVNVTFEGFGEEGFILMLSRQGDLLNQSDMNQLMFIVEVSRFEGAPSTLEGLKDGERPPVPTDIKPLPPTDIKTTDVTPPTVDLREENRFGFALPETQKFVPTEDAGKEESDV